MFKETDGNLTLPSISSDRDTVNYKIDSGVYVVNSTFKINGLSYNPLYKQTISFRPTDENMETQNITEDSFIVSTPGTLSITTEKEAIPL